jgi:uncharacterized membrane protein (DUF106 family)
MIEHGIYVIMGVVLLGVLIQQSLMTTREKTLATIMMVLISAGVGYYINNFYYLLILAILVGLLFGKAVEYTTRRRRIRCMKEAMRKTHPVSSKVI